MPERDCFDLIFNTPKQERDNPQFSSFSNFSLLGISADGIDVLDVTAITVNSASGRFLKRLRGQFVIPCYR